MNAPRPCSRRCAFGPRHALADVAPVELRARRVERQLSLAHASTLVCMTSRSRRRSPGSRCSGSSCPRCASRICSRRRLAAARMQSCAAISMPGVQKPHCSALRSWNAFCSARSSSDRDRPSIVSTRQPSACTASIRQPRTMSPSTRTVQAPHTPCSQPTCEPVSPSSSRRKSTRCWRARHAAASPARRSLSVRCRERVPCALQQHLGEVTAWWRNCCRGRPADSRSCSRSFFAS